MKEILKTIIYSSLWLVGKIAIIIPIAIDHINKSNVSQQSQIKNEMLKVHLNISTNKELTNKNYINNLNKILPSSEIVDVIKYINRNIVLYSNQTTTNKNSNLLTASLFYADSNNQTIQNLSNVLSDLIANTLLLATISFVTLISKLEYLINFN